LHAIHGSIIALPPRGRPANRAGTAAGPVLAPESSESPSPPDLFNQASFASPGRSGWIDGKSAGGKRQRAAGPAPRTRQAVKVVEPSTLRVGPVHVDPEGDGVGGAEDLELPPAVRVAPQNGAHGSNGMPLTATTNYQKLTGVVRWAIVGRSGIPARLVGPRTRARRRLWKVVAVPVMVSGEILG